MTRSAWLKDLVATVCTVEGTALHNTVAQAADKKPNIVIIWGDDIGQSNISAYSKGMMSYQTPNRPSR